MNEVIEWDINGVVEVNNYCISIYEEGDVCFVFICMFQFLNYFKNGVDIVFGIRVMIYFVKFNWKNVYKQIVIDYYGFNVGILCW